LQDSVSATIDQAIHWSCTATTSSFCTPKQASTVIMKGCHCVQRPIPLRMPRMIAPAATMAPRSHGMGKRGRTLFKATQRTHTNGATLTWPKTLRGCLGKKVTPWRTSVGGAPPALQSLPAAAHQANLVLLFFLPQASKSQWKAKSPFLKAVPPTRGRNRRRPHL
jgi:hypothetical protein